MIVTALMSAMNGFFSWVISLFDGIHLPDWAGDFETKLDQAATAISGMGVWVNFPLGVTVASTVIAVFLACLLVKIVLRVVAFLPMIGGAG